MSGRLPPALQPVLYPVVAAVFAASLSAPAPATLPLAWASANGVVGAVQPGQPGPDWIADLSEGEAVDIAVSGGVARLTASRGLLTLPPRRLAGPVGRVTVAPDVHLPSGADVQAQLRGRLTDGRWTEWLPAAPEVPVPLPVPATQVQLRLLLISRSGPEAGPEVRGVRVHAEPVAGLRVAAPPAPASFSVYATREGLTGGRTANGHRITRDDLFVALPSWRSLADRDESEYSVKVCVPGGHCAWLPVWDVGPWNTRDDYWSTHRERWRDLPRGVPQAQAAFQDGYHDGSDESGRRVVNPAGIDLSDGAFDTLLRLDGTAQVDVTYLWTGGPPLSTVDARSGSGLNHDADGGAGPESKDEPDATHDATSDATPDATHDATHAAAHTPSPGAPAAPRAGTRAADLNHAPGRDDVNRDRDDVNPDRDDSDQRHLRPGQAVAVRRAPSPGAPTVGMAADRAGVPVECATANGWLRIDADAYLPAAAVELADDVTVGPC